MLRLLAFFAVILAAGLGFAWLADNPGSVLISWRGQELATSFLVFLVALALLVGAVVLVFWLASHLFSAPDRIGRHFGRRRRDKGYRALSAGILAVGAGDADTARRMVSKSERWLSTEREPLIGFLDAQTAMIEGDHQRARRIFERMEKDPQTKLLALRGLYLESERVNDASAARRYAEEAVRLAPNVPWAGSAVLELKAKEGDFDGALGVLAAQRHSRLIEKTESQRLKAVLLTAKASRLAATQPAEAAAAARAAQKLEPTLVPAALVAARAAIRLGDHRQATKVLETAWKAAPHPEVGELYLRVRTADGAAERLRRARRLQSLQPASVESKLLVARAALDARDFAVARTEAEAAAALEPRESVFLLLADIEEADGNDVGRVRNQMSRALRAEKDPTWIADGVSSAEWMPVSPVTGRLDAFKWATPSERRIGTPLPEPLADEAEIVDADSAVHRSANAEIVPTHDIAASPKVPESGVVTRSDLDRKEARFAS